MLLSDRRTRDFALQALVVGGGLGAMAFLGLTAFWNVQSLGMSYGWSFLDRETGFMLTSVWPFKSTGHSTYLEIILFGAINTLRLAAIVIFFSVLFGIPIGAARLSKGPLSAIAGIYIHLVRGPSLLLHVLFWYALTRSFGTLQAAARSGSSIILSNRGVFIPAFSEEASATAIAAAAFCLALSAALFFSLRKGLRQYPTQKLTFWVIAIAATMALTTATTLFLHYGNVVDYPSVQGFRVSGGTAVSPEFFAFTVAAIVYISNYVAEIVRQGVQSIDRGVSEAAAALALKRWQVFLLIEMPLAMRNMLPPFTNLVTFIVKSTAAATAVGFSELFTVTSLSINHTGHVLELLGIMTTLYLVINTTITLALNYVNDRMKVVVR